MEPMKPNPGKAVNEDASKLAENQAAIARMEDERDKLAADIKNNAQEVVVVFVDMVGSTKLKNENSDKPHVWILIIRQFYEIVTYFIQQLGGRVIKYIGDEVMAVFDGPTKVDDAANFVSRIASIEKALEKVTGRPIQLKTAVDYGPVYNYTLAGHTEPDVLGTPVDRAARIGKYTKPGVVLASYDFMTKAGTAYRWSLVGEVALRGLPGKHKILQLGEKTMDIVEMEEISASDHSQLRNDVASWRGQAEVLTIEVQNLKAMNLSLQQKITELGEKPAPKDSVKPEAEETVPPADAAWEAIDADIDALKELIRDADVPPNQYARFLFLNRQGAGDQYNRFEGKQFDECIEAKLVVSDERMYYLSTDHPRNRSAIKVMDALECKLSEYEEKFRKGDDGDLYTYSLTDPKFWKEQIGYDVRFF